MEKLEKENKKGFYFLILVLGFYFIMRIILFSEIIHYFPLHSFTDGTSHMAQAFFLSNYGYFNIVPNWYQGFISMQFYGPIWFTLTAMIMGFFDLRMATFLIVVITYILGVSSFLILGVPCISNISYTKRIFMFLLFFVNPVSVSYLLNLGRLPELFAWVIFIFLFSAIWYYKKNSFGGYSILIFIFLQSLLLLSHHSVFILTSFVYLGLFLIKDKREKKIMALLGILSLIITSFWWIPYIRGINTVAFNFSPDLPGLKELVQISPSLIFQHIYSSIIAFTVLVSFYFYWRSEDKAKKEILFFLPVLILAFLFLSRVLCFVPILDKKYIFLI